MTKYIRVESNPSGASIWLELPTGVVADTGYVTPHTFSFMDWLVGQVKNYTLKKYGYDDCKVSGVVPLIGTKTISCTLPAIQGTLTVDSSPQGAAVHLNNVFKGGTPKVFELGPGTYNVRISMDPVYYWFGHVDTNISIEEGGDVKAVSANFTKAGRLTVRCVNDFECDVYIDNEKVGTTPIPPHKLATGNHAFGIVSKADHPKYWTLVAPWTTIPGLLTIVYATETVYNLKFERGKATLDITSSPSEMEIWLNRNNEGYINTEQTTPATVEIDAGLSYGITLKHQFFKDWTAGLTPLNAGHVADMNAIMEEKGWQDSGGLVNDILAGLFNWLGEDRLRYWVEKLGVKNVFDYLFDKMVSGYEEETDAQLETGIETDLIDFENAIGLGRGSALVIHLAPLIAIVGIILTVHGTVGILMWLGEERTQTASMGVFNAYKSGNWDLARDANKHYLTVIRAYVTWIKLLAGLAPFDIPVAMFYLEYAKTCMKQHELYEELINRADPSIPMPCMPAGGGEETGIAEIVAVKPDYTEQPSRIFIKYGKEWHDCMVETPRHMILPVGPVDIRLEATDWQDQRWEAEKTIMISHTLITPETIILEKVMGPPAIPEEFTAYVKGMPDGDTVEIRSDVTVDGETVTLPFTDEQGTKTEIRLLGINTPEKTTPTKGAIKDCANHDYLYQVAGKWADKAETNLMGMVYGRYVTIKVDPNNQYDGYGRILGMIFKDGLNVNLKQIQDGMGCCCYYEDNKYVDKAVFDAAETIAFTKKLGIWSLPTGKINVKTTPTGANIWLDGKDTGYVTNHTIETTVGSHTIKVTKTGYHSQSGTVNIETDTTKYKSFTLVPTTGSIECEGTPTGAEIYLDGISTGKYVTETITDVTPGLHTITYKKPPDYIEQSKTVTVIAGMASTVRMELQKVAPTTGSIHVTSSPTYAHILLDGVDTGKLTADTIKDVSAGTHTVTVTKDDYIPQTEDVTVVAGATQDVHFTLEKAPPSEDAYYNIIDIKKEDGTVLHDVKLFLDQSLVRTDNSFNLVFGPGKTINGIAAGLGFHTIRLEKGILSWTEHVQLLAEQTYNRYPVLTTEAPQTICEWIETIGTYNLTINHAVYTYYKSRSWTSLANKEFGMIPEAHRREIPLSLATINNAVGTYYYSKGWKSLGDRETGCSYGL